MAHVGLGSSVGDREALLGAAVRAMGATPGVEFVRVSAFRETVAVGPRGPDPSARPFLNGAATLRTSLTARDLLGALLGIELSLGRDRAREARWGPRTIDLDLLLYADAIIDEPAGAGAGEPALVVPHPRMHERRFVLEPLAEIAPDATHPGVRITVRELLAALRG